jgi:hypothetical protein
MQRSQNLLGFDNLNRVNVTLTTPASQVLKEVLFDSSSQGEQPLAAGVPSVFVASASLAISKPLNSIAVFQSAVVGPIRATRTMQGNAVFVNQAAATGRALRAMVPSPLICQSGLSASHNVSRSISGSVVVQSSVVASKQTFLRTLYGVMSGTSTTVASKQTLARKLVGAALFQSSCVGLIRETRPLSGLALSMSGTAGAVAVKRGVVGVGAGTSATSSSVSPQANGEFDKRISG